MRTSLRLPSSYTTHQVTPTWLTRRYFLFGPSYERLLHSAQHKPTHEKSTACDDDLELAIKRSMEDEVLSDVPLSADSLIVLSRAYQTYHQRIAQLAAKEVALAAQQAAIDAKQAQVARMLESAEKRVGAQPMPGSSAPGATGAPAAARRIPHKQPSQSQPIQQKPQQSGGHHAARSQQSSNNGGYGPNSSSTNHQLSNGGYAPNSSSTNHQLSNGGYGSNSSSHHGYGFSPLSGGYNGGPTHYSQASYGASTPHRGSSTNLSGSSMSLRFSGPGAAPMQLTPPAYTGAPMQLKPQESAHQQQVLQTLSELTPLLNAFGGMPF